MIGVVLLLFLSAIVPAASAQYIVSPGSPNAPLTIGSLAVSSIFTFLFLLQIVHCFIAIITMRGHRLAYLMLLLAIAFTVISLLALIAYTVLVANVVAGPSVRTAVVGLLLFFRNWSLILIFIAIIAFLWDRETMVRAKLNGSSGKRNVPLVVIHVALIVVMFIFATTQASASVNLRIAAAQGFSRKHPKEYIQRVHTVNSLTYTFYAFVIVSTVDVIVAAVLLSGAARKASISDKVTNIVLFAVTPLYTLFNLSHLVFLITLSPSGLPKAGAEVTTIRSADLAQKVIENLLIFLIFAVLLFLSFNRASWDFESTHTTPTPQAQQEYLAHQVVQYQIQPYPQQPYASQPYGTQTPPAQPYAQYPEGTQVQSSQPYPQYAVPQPYEYVVPPPYLEQDASQQDSLSAIPHPSLQPSPQPLIQNTTSK